MARFVKGDVVVVPFLYSDLTEAKRRPALVVAGLPGTDLILFQITSQAKRDDFAVALDSSSFEVGSLSREAISGQIACLQQTNGLWCLR